MCGRRTSFLIMAVRSQALSTEEVLTRLDQQEDTLLAMLDAESDDRAHPKVPSWLEMIRRRWCSPVVFQQQNLASFTSGRLP